MNDVESSMSGSRIGCAMPKTISEIFATGVHDMYRQIPSTVWLQTLCICLALPLLGPVHAQAWTVEPASIHLAQTHVLNADGELGPNGEPELRLVGWRDTLFKVNFVASEAGVASDRIKAWLTLYNAAGDSYSLALREPADLPILPTSFASAPADVFHSFVDSHTTVIPGHWVEPGFSWQLSWQIYDSAGELLSTHLRSSGPLNVGPPHKLILSVVDVRWFGESSTGTPFPEDLVEEMEQKLPVSDLELRRPFFQASFDHVAVPGSGARAPMLVSSSAEWSTHFGSSDADRSVRWALALQQAAGLNYGEVSNFCIVNHGSVAPSGTEARDAVCSAPVHPGTFWTALGHSFMLPDWSGSEPEAMLYPYRDELSYLGLPTGDAPANTHVGPYWAFDSRNTYSTIGRFIPAWADANDDGYPDRWKGSPLEGEWQLDVEPGFNLAHLSDYAIRKINERLDAKVAWFSQDNAWINDMDWANYGQGWFFTGPDGYVPFGPDGTELPAAADRDVYSIMVAGSMAYDAPEFTHIYPLIGRYKSNIRTQYDPSTQQAELAASGRCPANGCDLTLRIVQNGVTKHIALEQDWDTSRPYSDPESFFELAVNVPASEGFVEFIELLYTPDVELVGLPATETVMDSRITQARPQPAPPVPDNRTFTVTDVLNVTPADVSNVNNLKEIECAPGTYLAGIRNRMNTVPQDGQDSDYFVCRPYDSFSGFGEIDYGEGNNPGNYTTCSSGVVVGLVHFPRQFWHTPALEYGPPGYLQLMCSDTSQILHDGGLNSLRYVRDFVIAQGAGDNSLTRQCSTGSAVNKVIFSYSTASAQFPGGGVGPATYYEKLSAECVDVPDENEYQGFIEGDRASVQLDLIFQGIRGRDPNAAEIEAYHEPLTRDPDTCFTLIDNQVILANIIEDANKQAEDYYYICSMTDSNYRVGFGVGRVLAGLCGATDPHECDALPSLKYLPVTVRSMDTSAHFEHWYNYLTGPKYLHDDFKCTASDGTEQNCLNGDTVVEEFLKDTITVAGGSWDPEEHYALVQCNGGLCANEQVVFRGPSYQGLAGVTRARTYLSRNNCIREASHHHMNLWQRLVCAIDPLHRRDQLEDMLPIVVLPTTPEESEDDVYAVFSCARGTNLADIKASVLDENVGLPQVSSAFDCGLDEDTMNYLASQTQSLGSAWEEIAVEGVYTALDMYAQGLIFGALTGGVGYLFAEAAEAAEATEEGVNLARQVGVTLARTSINGYFLFSAVRALPNCNGDENCEISGAIQLGMSLASMGEVAEDFEAGKAAARDYLRSQNPDSDLLTPLLEGMEEGYRQNGGTGDLFPEGSEYTPEGPTARVPGSCR